MPGKTGKYFFYPLCLFLPTRKLSIDLQSQCSTHWSPGRPGQSVSGSGQPIPGGWSPSWQPGIYQSFPLILDNVNNVSKMIFTVSLSVKCRH